MISILKQPSKYSPSGNPLFLSVESNNSDIVYFKVLIKSGGDIFSSLKVYVTPDAPTIGNLDLSNILFNYTSTPLNIQPVLIKSFANGYLDYSIEITEMILNDGVIEAGSTSIINDLTIYNAKLNDIDFQFYSASQYYINPSTKAKFLSDKPGLNKINSWSKEFLYFLADTVSTISKVEIKVTTSTGSTTYQQAFSAGANKLHRLNISPKNLATSLLIDFTDVQYFEVYLIDASGNILTEVKTYTYSPIQCGYEPLNVLWLNKLGGVTNYTFINPKEVKTVKRSIFQANRYKNYSISTDGIINNSQKTFNVSQTSDYTVKSPILNDVEYQYITDMLSSEQIFIELVDGSIYPIILKTTSSEVKQRKYQTSSQRFQFNFEAESGLLANASKVDYNSQFFNTVQSGTATKNNCGVGETGTEVIYTVNANTYSAISQAIADGLAAADVEANKQSYANANGGCTAPSFFYNIEKSGLATKNNCDLEQTGTTITYTVYANTYTGSTQSIADNLAQSDVDANKQTYANSNGSCYTVPSSYKNFSIFQTSRRLRIEANDGTISCSVNCAVTYTISVFNGDGTYLYTTSENTIDVSCSSGSSFGYNTGGSMVAGLYDQINIVGLSFTPFSCGSDVILVNGQNGIGGIGGEV